MDKKKMLSLLLLVSICASGASCGDKTPGNDTQPVGDSGDSSEAEVTTAEIVPELPDVKYDGYTFTFYGRQGGASEELYVEEENGDTLNDAVYQRNAKIAEKYDIKFALVTDANNGTGAVQSILASDDDYDVIVPPARYAFWNYVTQGLALDWNTDLPYVELDKPWWAQDARESFNVCGKLRVMTGDISYENLGASKAIFFNQRIFDENNWEYPYQLVKDGEWTFDKMAEYAKAAYRDLDGNSTAELGKDLFGYATGWWSSPVSVLFSAGQRIAAKNEAGELELCINNERTIEVYEKFFDFLKNNGCLLLKQDDSSPISNAFSDGNLLFMEATVNDAKSYRDMEDDFGIIPVPKFYADMDNYCTSVDAGVNLFVVPITASNAERTSVILEALAYESYKNTIHSYYDIALGAKYARDEDSVEMLDIIRETRFYDSEYFHGTTVFGSIGWELSKMSEPNFASYYAQNEESAITKLKELNESYKD